MTFVARAALVPQSVPDAEPSPCRSLGRGGWMRHRRAKGWQRQEEAFGGACGSYAWIPSCPFPAVAAPSRRLGLRAGSRVHPRTPGTQRQGPAPAQPQNPTSPRLTAMKYNLQGLGCLFLRAQRCPHPNIAARCGGRAAGGKGGVVPGPGSASSGPIGKERLLIASPGLKCCWLQRPQEKHNKRLHQ